MKNFLFIFLLLFSTSSWADEVIRLSARECVEFALVQFDAKDFLDKGKVYTYPKNMPSEIQVQVDKATRMKENEEYPPIVMAHAFLDFCIQHEGHFAVPDKI